MADLIVPFPPPVITTSPHSRGKVEAAQQMAGYADPHTTRRYDRRDKKIARNILERMSI